MGFWSQKRVTITGGAGFLGSFLVDRLRDEARVFVPRSSDFNLVKSAETHQMYAKSEPDILIHLAARVGGIEANRRSPGQFFYENMAMGMNVIEEGRKYGGLEKIVLVGTTCSYPKILPIPFKESDLWNGYPEETNAPYGVAKRALLTMAWAYREEYGLNIIYLIPANLYGPRDNFDLQTGHVIPSIVRKLVEAKKEEKLAVEAWGSGRPTREFLYVEDAARGILLGGERYNGREPVNLGSGEEISIRDLVQLIASIIGYEGEVTWDASKPNGQPRRSLDTKLAEEAFGFRSRVALKEGLVRTVEWYVANSGGDPTAGRRSPLHGSASKGSAGRGGVADSGQV